MQKAQVIEKDHNVWPYLAKATIYDGFKKYYRRSPQTGRIPEDTITVKGIIDPKKPNVLEGSLPVVVDSFLPLTGTVTWDLTRWVSKG